MLKSILQLPLHNSTYPRNCGTRHHPRANPQCRDDQFLSACIKKSKQFNAAAPWVDSFAHWTANSLSQSIMTHLHLNNHISCTLTLTAQCLPQIIVPPPLANNLPKLPLLTNIETSSDSVDHRANFHFNMKRRRQLNRSLHRILHTTSRLHTALMVRHLSETNPGLARVLL